MSAETKEHIKMAFHVTTTALASLCLWLLSDLRGDVKQNADAVQDHLSEREIHETHVQKSATAYKNSRSVISEWDKEVNGPRWDRVFERLDDMEKRLDALKEPK